jgi:hypothetical protein
MNYGRLIEQLSSPIPLEDLDPFLESILSSSDAYKLLLAISTPSDWLLMNVCRGFSIAVDNKTCTPEEATPALLKLCYAKSPDVSFAAFEALSYLPRTPLIQTHLDMLSDHEDEMFRRLGKE